MTYLSFMKTMLGEDLSELGFTYAGTDKSYPRPVPVWYKLVDDCIIMNVASRKLSYGDVQIRFRMDSLFSPYCGDTLLRHNLEWIVQQYKHTIGENVDPRANGLFYSNALYYSNESDEENQRMIEYGRSAFALIKPILASVHDLESCFNAKQKAGYLEWVVSAKNWFDGEFTTNDYLECPTIHAYCLLCATGKYDKAAEYISKDISQFEKIHGNQGINARLLQEHKDKWEPYMKMALNREVNKIQAMMRDNYLANCDILEAELKIKINRAAGLCLLS